MKRLFAAALAIALLSLSLCGCQKEKVYLPKTLKCYSGDTLNYTVNYTYDDEGRLLKEVGSYETQSFRNYSNTYTYNSKGELISLEKTENNEDTVYTAEKITKYKYLLTAEDGRTITLIFDNNGHIISFKNSDGYLSEYAYTYSKSGKPTAIKRQIVNPSGSNKIFDYTVKFTDEDTYEYYDNADDSYYFAVDCIVGD